MANDFSSIHNHQERAVIQAVEAQAPKFPALAGDAELLADVACIALNRLPPRYIRHAIDYSFYLPDQERQRDGKLLDEAVRYAFGYVIKRLPVAARA